MTTVKRGGATAPKKKPARENQRAILETPVKLEGELPIKKKGGRKSTLEPIVEKLQSDPGEWYKVGKGKIGTIYQMANRLRKNYPGVEAQASALPSDDTQGDCYARYVKPE